MNSIIVNFDNTSDINAAYIQLKKQYPKSKVVKADINIDEMLDNEYLLSLALERKKHDNGVRISFEDHLAKRGLTLKDIEEMEDVEIE